jgi:GT2 family glycosyltransferase
VRAGAPRVGIAIATRDRRASLLRTLARLRALPERPPIAVADNGSRDGTVAALRAAFGDAADVTLLALGENRGGAARTAAAATLPTPYVAFSDDDSWWEPGALARAAALLDAHPRVGLVAARILVGPQRRLDPTCALMARSPLRGISALAETATGPGIPVLGFLACGAVVRRDAFLAAGGFAQRYGIGGEERLLALDLAADGWQVVYVPEIVACHCPQPGPERAGRAATAVRNDLWSTWLRRPARRIPGASARTLREAGPRSATTRGGAAALRALPWVLRERRPLPAAVEHAVRTLERAQRNGGTRLPC